jgi:hypothetical protein
MTWDGGIGIGRLSQPSGPVMVVHRPGTRVAQLAIVDGSTFADLPDLLEAVGGEEGRIKCGDPIPVCESDLLSPARRRAPNGGDYGFALLGARDNTRESDAADV